MNKTILITGGSSGIGAAAARALRQQGATVAITGRSPETLRLAKEIGADAFLCDFAKLRDVRALAAQLLAKYPRIDVLANNVGGVIATRQVTADGHEKTLQVNHLGGFLLTLLLRERLEASAGVVIDTSSGAHRFGHIDLREMESAGGYNAWRAYGSAKLMNILHAAEINRRFRGVRGVSFHPGVVATGFAREGARFVRVFYETALRKLFMISPEKGADTLVWLASTDDWTPGAFYIRRKRARTSREGGNAQLARELWEWSERAVAE
ncbi:MAG: SDR family NAD(P)-dependent oxidoreductase [Acidobacteriota bacterium]|nr:SDR family NAD(P)-dependent oxidoreductase [Acidobacteriota bacterium]